MPTYKAVDSSALNTNLTSLANAIRTKGGTSAQLAFPSGYVSAINNLPSGGGGTVIGNATVTAQTTQVALSVGAANHLYIALSSVTLSEALSPNYDYVIEIKLSSDFDEKFPDMNNNITLGIYQDGNYYLYYMSFWVGSTKAATTYALEALLPNTLNPIPNFDADFSGTLIRNAIITGTAQVKVTKYNRS